MIKLTADLPDDWFSVRLGNWEFGVAKEFCYWWWNNGYVYYLLGYFWFIHYQPDTFKDIGDMGYGLIYQDKIYID